MKLADEPTKVVDEVMTEVRAVKRTISARHGNDIDRLIDALMEQERSSQHISEGMKSEETSPNNL